MKAEHLEFHVEEPSMEVFLRALLPRVLPSGCEFRVHAYRGKSDLLGKLPARLRAYSQWLPPAHRIIVVVDRDGDDCAALKAQLEAAAAATNLRTRATCGSSPWQVVNRVAIEELEAWYFGDWTAVHNAYPRVSPTIPAQAKYRDADAVKGGTWEAFERVLQAHGYFATGLAKIAAARAIGAHFDPGRCSSASFATFHAAIMEATA